LTHFLHIAYEGTKFRGWQRQPNVRSVQETIEETLKKIFARDITVYGCGRTDAGVHASQYYLHIHLTEEYDFDLKFRINKNLPDEIVVYDVIKMEDKQHCRYDAIARTYDYFIHLEKNPVLVRYSSFYEIKDLDIPAMQMAAALIQNYDDFRAICKQPDFHKHTRCNVSHSKLFVSDDAKRLRFTITANRFLRGMVRLCIYYLLEVGEGRMTVEAFEQTLANKIVIDSMRPSFPNGLFLSKVVYPYLSLPPRENICSLLKQGLKD